MIASATRRVLIPAAGFGKRVGSPPAKELLPDPESGRPLIEFAIDRAREAGARPVVITRTAKEALRAALATYPDVETRLIEGSSEWPETPLLAEDSWGDTNIVLLPDTRFVPPAIVESMFLALERGTDLTFGVFAVECHSTWGVVRRSEHTWQICEKPDSSDGSGHAWGIFGFKREFGRSLLSSMLASTEDHRWHDISGLVALFELTSFVDLTRSK